jgi:hypothetical protein
LRLPERGQGISWPRSHTHDTRRIAATTWAVHEPFNAAGVKDLLGDRSDRVIAQHYNFAGGIEASRKMANVLVSLKKA